LSSVSGELVPERTERSFPLRKRAFREGKILKGEEKGIPPPARGNDPERESFSRMHIVPALGNEAWRGRKGL
jgi:hypothetical protein